MQRYPAAAVTEAIDVEDADVAVLDAAADPVGMTIAYPHRHAGLRPRPFPLHAGKTPGRQIAERLSALLESPEAPAARTYAIERVDHHGRIGVALRLEADQPRTHLVEGEASDRGERTRAAIGAPFVGGAMHVCFGEARPHLYRL